MTASLNHQSEDRKLTSRDVLQPLVSAGFMTLADGENLMKAWNKSIEHPLNLLLSVNIPDRENPGKYFTQDEILAEVARGLKVSYQRVDIYKISLESVSGVIPHAYADRLKIVPIEITADKIVVLSSQPLSLSWVEEFYPQVKRKIEIRLAAPKQIQHLLNEIYVIQKAFRAMAQEQGARGSEKLRLLKQGKVDELDALIEKSRARKLGVQDGYITKIVDWLINYATLERASDIHLEPKKGMAQVRFRVDGDLRTVYRLDHEALLMIISRFKILADLKLDEKRKPQDGGFKRNLENGKPVEMRISTLPTNYGEKIVVRIFDKNVASQDLSFIGFEENDLKQWTDLITQPQGLILVTGPTGSGKTTTLYTSLNKVATADVNVCTAEDPIEMEVESFNQVQVNPQIGMGFADCIRAFLRQDPDIIMVGEIRDLETGEMAIQSSLTGHLVFSTLHTNGALATIQRLIDLGLPSFLINSSLTGILAQRLVKKLCPHCKLAVPTDASKWAALMDGETLPMPEKVFEARGCDECKQTGYIGRLCVYELVQMNDNIKKIIHEKVDISELREKTRGLYKSIRVSGGRKVISGETSMEEVLKVVY